MKSVTLGFIIYLSLFASAFGSGDFVTSCENEVDVYKGDVSYETYFKVDDKFMTISTVISNLAE